MNRRAIAAVLLQIAIMTVVLIPPLVVKYSGTTAYLQTAPVDPRDLFRGDYVMLGYEIGRDALSPEEARAARESGRAVYVTLTTERPARRIATSVTRPAIGEGAVCLVGRSRGDGWIDFPQIAQYFVPEGEGLIIERQRGENLLAKVSVSASCNAVLTGLEPR